MHAQERHGARKLVFLVAVTHLQNSFWEGVASAAQGLNQLQNAHTTLEVILFTFQTCTTAPWPDSAMLTKYVSALRFYITDYLVQFLDLYISSHQLHWLASGQTNSILNHAI